MSWRDTLKGMLDEALEAGGVPRQGPINYPQPLEGPLPGDQRRAAPPPANPAGEATARPRRVEELRPETRAVVEKGADRPRRPTPAPEVIPTAEQRRTEPRQPRPPRTAALVGQRRSAAQRAAIRAALASPAGVQQALIIGEILGPPLALRPLDEDR